MVVVTAGSVLAGPPGAVDEPTRFATEDPTSGPTPATADPQVLRDVIDAAVPLPGDAQLRNIRVQTFLYGWGIQRCGGTPPSLDSTADRFEQDLLPSRDLIRERGFTEPSEESFRGYRDDCQIGNQLAANAPAWEDWRELVGPWLELAREKQKDPELVAPRESMVQCLRQTTGLGISDKDPVDSLFSATERNQTRAMATAFADCGEGYFGNFEELLREERPEFVEEHRGLLEAFAQQLAALGYQP